MYDRWASQSEHWRHLANTTERSLRGGIAALRQITLNSSFVFFIHLAVAFFLDTAAHLYMTRINLVTADVQ